MARVPVEFDEYLEDDQGQRSRGVIAICSQCGHKTESLGTTEKSRRRCLALMREECPEGEENFYVDSVEDGGGESRMPDRPVKPWWEKPQSER